MTRKQSAADHYHRLMAGCCPVHGIPMTQTDGWKNQVGGALDGARVTIVECPRKDCEIRAYAAGPDGPWELLPGFQPLLSDE